MIEADEETLPYAEEDWQDPEQIEIPQNLEPDLSFTIQTRKTRHRTSSVTVSQDIVRVDDYDEEWVDDRSTPEVEFDDEQQQSYEQDLTNLRVLEWLNEMTSHPKETRVKIRDIDRESMKYIKTERNDPSWAAQEGQLLIFASHLDLKSGVRSTETSLDIFCPGSGGRN